MESFYPLHVYVCERWFLAQVQQYVRPDRIFTEYACFSSYSDKWLRHAKTYTDMIVPRIGLGPTSTVVEPGSNDGYLFHYFMARGVPVLGTEPAANVAANGARTGMGLFGREAAGDLVAAGTRADLLIGNNV